MNRKLTTLEQVICVAAAIVFIAAFLAWWDVGGLEIDGWSTHVTGAVGIVLSSIAAVYLDLRRREFRIWAPPYGDAWVVAALAVAGLVFVIVDWTRIPAGATASYGMWIALVAAAAEAAAALARALNR